MKKYPASNKSVTATVVVCLGMTFGMLGMAYAAVPLYQLFCQVTGYGGTTQVAEDSTGEILDRRITVRFDANVSNNLDWEFSPKQRSVTLRIGEKGQAFYTAKNLDDITSHGTATFNVSPQAAGIYFNKIECFCFTEQQLAAGQAMDMPVIFFVDPEIVNDPLLKETDTLTLSYTFFPDEKADRKLSQTKSALSGG